MRGHGHWLAQYGPGKRTDVGDHFEKAILSLSITAGMKGNLPHESAEFYVPGMPRPMQKQCEDASPFVRTGVLLFSYVHPS